MYLISHRIGRSNHVVVLKKGWTCIIFYVLIKTTAVYYAACLFLHTVENHLLYAQIIDRFTTHLKVIGM